MFANVSLFFAIQASSHVSVNTQLRGKLDESKLNSEKLQARLTQHESALAALKPQLEQALALLSKFDAMGQRSLQSLEGFDVKLHSMTELLAHGMQFTFSHVSSRCFLISIV